MMRRSLFIFAVLSLLIAACATPPQPTALPVPTRGSPQATPSLEATKVASLKDYVASDPSLVGTTGRPQLVDFFAFWCTTCQAMRPIIHDLQDEYGLIVDFIYLDIDAENTKALQKQLTFTGLRPTIIFMDPNGKEVSRLVGAHTRQELAEKLDELVGVG
jgi:thiol-disulfide isomerase/thioredoxin